MTIENIKKILADQLYIDINDISEDSDIIDDLGADSLDIAELIMSVEEEYGIIVTDERLMGIRTIGQLTDL
ncbi:MAG: acyl carrier protein, partial [Clostridiales bacterium]|nr:acyl carrier protein [Clostridiales bacterium]